MNSAIIFVVSFLALTALFLSKHREIKTGEKTFIGKVLAKFDGKAANLSSLARYRLYQTIQATKFFFLVHLPEKGKIGVHKTKETVMNGFQKQKDAIMGKKELKSNGSSSFFLRKMSENKKDHENENGEREKIESGL